MAIDAKSVLQSKTTSTASANSTAAALNTLTGSPNFGYRVNFVCYSMSLTTSGATASTVVPTLYRSEDSSTWIAFWQGRTQTLGTAVTTFTADPLISMEPSSPYLAAGIVTTLGGGGAGLSVVWYAALATGKEDRA